MASPSDGPIGFSGSVGGASPAGMPRDPIVEPPVQPPRKRGLTPHCQNLLGEIAAAVKAYHAAIEGTFEAARKREDSRARLERAAAAYATAETKAVTFGANTMLALTEYLDAERTYHAALEAFIHKPAGEDAHESAAKDEAERRFQIALERWERDKNRNEMYEEDVRSKFQALTDAQAADAGVANEERYWKQQVDQLTAQLMRLWEDYDVTCTG